MDDGFERDKAGGRATSQKGISASELQLLWMELEERMAWKVLRRHIWQDLLLDWMWDVGKKETSQE